jgi:hypothetical protein
MGRIRGQTDHPPHTPAKVSGPGKRLMNQKGKVTKNMKGPVYALNMSPR